MLDASDPGEARQEDATPTAFAIEKGTTIGKCVVLQGIGRGGMGVVYRAYHPELEREVAIKVLHPLRENDDEFRRRQERLTREAKATAKLSHPNVVTIFDAGEEHGQKYIVMELLKGGTLREWIKARHPSWREIVRVFVEVGRGLESAHKARYIHRDFKPENVLFDEQGRPKVLDFGLVRKAAVEKSAGEGPLRVVEQPIDVRGQPLPAVTQGLSVTGSLLGTNSYMAPEQFRGEDVDERTDQFAFCVSLYEALYGKRPFSGETLYDLAANVVESNILEAPPGSDVPGWVRRIVLTGLSTTREDRFRSMDELLRALERDPAVRRAKWLLGAAMVALVAAAIGVGHVTSERRRRAFERRLRDLESEYDRAIGDARSAKDRALVSRRAALATFDDGQRNEGDRAWPGVRTALASADASFERAQQALRAAWDLDRERPGLGDRLAAVIVERAMLAEEQGRRDDVAKLLAELAPIDQSGRAKTRWAADGAAALRGVDPAWRLTLQELVRAAEWSWKPRPVAWEWTSGTSAARLPPGSYRLLVTTPAEPTYFLPFVIEPGRRTSLDLAPIARARVPHGFHLVLGGPTLVGEIDDTLRVGFCETVPLHGVLVGSFLMAENETTNDDWIAYLDDLGGAEREARRPLVSTVQGFLELRRGRDRAWTFAMRPTRRLYEARGSKIRYQSRDRLAEQEWRRFPVAGIAADDAKAYAAWLAVTGRVPRARLCTEVEWERAARGADGRPFPMGDHLSATQANFDQTYGRVSEAFGPDQVGMHAASNSPFGIADLAGNVWEIVQPSFGREPVIIRGGGYFHDDQSARSSNRHVIDLSARAPYVGVRICADIAAAEGQSP